MVYQKLADEYDRVDEALKKYKRFVKIKNEVEEYGNQILKEKGVVFANELQNYLYQKLEEADV